MNADGGQDNELDVFLAGVEKKAFQIAHSALWNTEDALDAVQEAMMRLVKYYRNKPATEWPALFRTVLNSQVNNVRRARMLQQARGKLVSLTGLGQRDDTADPADTTELELSGSIREDGFSDAESGVLGFQVGKRIESAIQKLSARQRQVFLLREMHGWSIKETASALDCSETSVKQHHFRAMGAMRKQLGDLWDHEHE